MASTLVRLFVDYNMQVYKKRTSVPAKATKRFEEVERMLTRSDIDLEDYTLTTFADRVWIGCKVGHLTWQVFISSKSLLRYADRLKQGAEVKANKKETRDFLSMELAYGEAVITQLIECEYLDDELVILIAGVPPNWSGDNRRPVQEACKLLSKKYRTPMGTYQEIANHVKNRRTRAELEPRLQAKSDSTYVRGSMVA